jgi:hypothetical protein
MNEYPFDFDWFISKWMVLVPSYVEYPCIFVLLSLCFIHFVYREHSETWRNCIKHTEEHFVSFSDIYTLQVQSYDYFKLGLLSNPKLGMWD